MQVDHWVFLRYAEGVMLPVIALGVLSLLRMNVRERLGTAICSLMILLPAAVLLQHDLGVRGPTSRVDNHFVMSAGFWPYNFDPSINFRDWIGTTPASAMTYPSFIRWYLIGAIGVALALTVRKWILLPLLLLSLLLVPRIQTNWHSWLTNEYSSVPKIAEVARDFVSTRDSRCVGFLDPQNSTNSYSEPYLRLTFYLVGKNLKRIAFAQPNNECVKAIITPKGAIDTTVATSVVSEADDFFLLTARH
jgi:hypothetical protein